MKAKFINFFKLLPILTLMAIAFSPKVLARSLSADDKNKNDLLFDESISSVKSPINFVTHWLKSGELDGSTNGEWLIPFATYVRYLRWVNLFEGDGQTHAGNRKGGANRGDNSIMASHLNALIPKTNLGLTVDGHPTFWFYVPENDQMVSHAKFTLLDENQKSVLTEPILVSLSGTPGLVSVTLPTTEKELEIGQKYRWFFELECDAENSSENTQVDVWVEGWVQRVAPIPGIEPDDYIAYAERGIWYNALTPLARMRQQKEPNPTLQNDWVDLLKAVELESLADVSIADCCDDMKRANRL